MNRRPGLRLGAAGLALLAALVLSRPVTVRAETETAPTATTPPAPAGEDDRDSRLWLILGGTVAGVGGLWLNLYKRGKK